MLDRLDLLTGELLSLDAPDGEATVRTGGSEQLASGILTGTTGDTLMSFDASLAGNTEWIDARLAESPAAQIPREPDSTALDDHEAEQLDELLLAVGLAITAMWPGSPANEAESKKRAAIC